MLDNKGKKIRLSSTIDANESQFLFDFIINNKEIESILEIGCGHGITSLTISSALEERTGSKHTIIDPFSGTMIILKKLGQDNRPWDYHKIF